jgi:rubrerythrin
VTLDERSIDALVEQGWDLHSAGMRATREQLDEVVESGLAERSRRGDGSRRQFLRRSLLAAGGMAAFGAAALERAHAVDAASVDVDLLQTAAAIEVVAITVYQQAAVLDPNVSGTTIKAMKDFIAAVTQQHTDHRDAFNAAIKALGGKEQIGPDRVLLETVVNPGVAKIRAPGDVIALVAALEETAAASYVKFGSSASDAAAVKAFATIAPIEATHLAMLRSISGFFALGHPELITVPLDLTKVPAAAGGAPYPDSFYPIQAARDPAEGKVVAG